MSVKEYSRALFKSGVASFPAMEVRSKLSPIPALEEERLSLTFKDLPPDRYMGDGGQYRFRRFSKFRLTPDQQLRLSEDTSIHQSVEDNSLNGGVKRTFEPLAPWTRNSVLLRALLEHDLGILRMVEPELFQKSILVGVHQVRIVAEPSRVGQPTPEGIHRDSERYTFQHFWDREGVDGGEFVAYDHNKSETFRWLQVKRFDSVLFRGTTWHSATPICCAGERDRGHRDIFLIDFDEA